jgi:RTX calcium-binding nonapeptide repeat (4 copies)
VVVGTAGQGAAGVGLGISVGGVLTGATAADRLSAGLSALGAVAGVVASTPLVPPQARLGALLAQGVLTYISGAISRDPALINNLISDLTRALDWIGEGLAAGAAVINTITGDQAQPDHFDVLYGSVAGDDITGLDGNDALNGGVGTDKISGGIGDDLIGGGAGSDVIYGGAGNDWIFTAMDLTAPARISPSDVWPPIGQPLPPTATILSQGMTWGIYSDLQSNGQRPIFINYVAVGTPDDAPDVIDGGDGNGRLSAYASRATALAVTRSQYQ